MINIVLNNSNIDISKAKQQGKARKFTSKFLEAGIINYEDIGFGLTLLKKVTIDKFINSIEGSPLIILHKDVDRSNVKQVSCGYVTKVWFEPSDGWYYCEGWVNDDDAEFLIKEANWSVSCSFEITEKDTTGGIYNDIAYQTEILNGNFRHLAIVDNPRFKDANIVLNSSNKKKSFIQKFNPFGKKVDTGINNNIEEVEMAKNNSNVTKVKEICMNESLSEEEKDEALANLLNSSSNEDDKDKTDKSNKADNQDKDKAKDKSDNSSDEDDKDKDKSKSDKADNNDDEDDEDKAKDKDKADNSSDFDRVRRRANDNGGVANNSSQSLYQPTEERIALGKELY